MLYRNLKCSQKTILLNPELWGGGQINIAIKSGTNNLHGSLFGFLRNDNLDVRNFFDGRGGTQKGEFKQQQFGATIGGPIVSNKLFYFANYEGFRMSKEVPRLFTVPTDDMRRGIFANRITDPNSTTRAAFTGNAIPDARINSVSRAYLAYIPQANLPGAVNNYAAAPAEKNDNNQFNFKTNYRKGDKDDIAIRYSFFDVDGYQPYGYVPRTSGDVSLPGFGTFINQRSHNIGITETHVFKANLIGELRLGYNRTGGGRIQENKDINFGGPLGIVGYPTDANNFGLPKINGATTNSFGDTTAVTSRNDNDIQTDLTLSWFAGRHNINMGGMYRRLQFNPLNLSTVRGQYFFEGGYTGDRFADFLLGLPSRATGSTGADKLYMRGNEYAAFIQDDFKLSRKLTLNLGLRYEYTSPLHEKYNQWSIIDLVVIQK